MENEIVVTGVLDTEDGTILILAHPNGFVEELGAPETPSGLAAVALCELSHLYAIPVNVPEWERLLAAEKIERKKKKLR